MNDRYIALSDVLVACREFADHCYDSSERLDHDELSALFAQLAETHTGIADRMAQTLRDAGTLPREPDPEVEEVQRLARHFKARLSIDANRTIVEERIRAEQEVESLISTARQFEWPDATAEYLERAQSAVADARVRMGEIAGHL